VHGTDAHLLRIAPRVGEGHQPREWFRPQLVGALLGHHHRGGRVEGERSPLRPSTRHPFWVRRGDSADGAWVESGKMKVGDLLQTVDGNWRRVTAITPLKGQETVYNFTVDQNHDYFVGETGFLVHNSPVCNCQIFQTYKEFVDASLKYDGLFGHELWQFANQKALGLTIARMFGFASVNNPVIAVDSATHQAISAAQRAFNAAGQSAEENIMANAQILRNMGIPENKVQQLTDWALQHAKNCGQ